MQKNSETRLFLDSTGIIGAITKRKPIFRKIFEDYKENLYANEYVIKETRRVLKNDFGCPEELINKAIDNIRVRFKVVKTPSKEEFKKIKISDKADRPIVCSAKKEKCILVTDDKKLYKDAKKYVITKLPEEVVIK
ncbi:MAG: PIN domain-containing protein [Methanosarcinales archaeon]